MNFSYAPAPAGPIMKPLSNSINSASSGFSGLFSKFWAVMLLIFIVFVAMVIYYKTIGYYMEIGWNRIRNLIFGGASVDVDVGNDAAVSATLKPMDAPPSSPMGPSDQRTPGLPGASNGSPMLSSLSIGGPKKEVFNVSRNIYTFNDASAVCSALGAELATYEQVQEAYEQGADWCNYGWIKGQMAVYPTQKETYDKLQKGAPEYRNACGRIGMNGGYFDNPELRFGVTCYGVKPSRNATDELLESSVSLPPSTEEIEYDKKVQKFREQLNTMVVLPFKRGQWTE
jgi:hypothetical protein